MSIATLNAAGSAGVPVSDCGREEFNIGFSSPGADITPPLSDSSSHGESRSLGHITASFSAGFESVRDASLIERATLRRKIVLRSPGLTPEPAR